MLKFQAVAEKTAKNLGGYFFAAPRRPTWRVQVRPLTQRQSAVSSVRGSNELCLSWPKH